MIVFCFYFYYFTIAFWKQNEYFCSSYSSSSSAERLFFCQTGFDIFFILNFMRKKWNDHEIHAWLTCYSNSAFLEFPGRQPQISRCTWYWCVYSASIPQSTARAIRVTWCRAVLFWIPVDCRGVKFHLRKNSNNLAPVTNIPTYPLDIFHKALTLITFVFPRRGAENR